MKSLSGVGLGLSVVFGCLFLALAAELYYLLWWKKRLTNRDIENDYSSPARELFFMFCLKRSTSLRHAALDPQELCSSVGNTESLVHDPEAQLHLQSSNKDFLLKPYGEDGLETEFMRLHNLSGPPRFLFTIIEETKEDLESEDGKSKSGMGSRSKSLSDLLVTLETPYLTPMASPPFFTPPLTPMDSYNQRGGFNPLFESLTDAEFNKVKSSPPPKFKFLQDAEEKLSRKLLEAAAKDEFVQENINKDEEVEDGPFITIVVDKHKETEFNHSSTSQVLPLDSSPSTFGSPINKKPILH